MLKHFPNSKRYKWIWVIFFKIVCHRDKLFKDQFACGF